MGEGNLFWSCDANKRKHWTDFPRFVEKTLEWSRNWRILRRGVRPVFDKLTLLAIIITTTTETTTATRTNASQVEQSIFISISNETQHANDRFIFHAVVSAVNQVGPRCWLMSRLQTQLGELPGICTAIATTKRSAVRAFHIFFDSYALRTPTGERDGFIHILLRVGAMDGK